MTVSAGEAGLAPASMEPREWTRDGAGVEESLLKWLAWFEMCFDSWDIPVSAQLHFRKDHI